MGSLRVVPFGYHVLRHHGAPPASRAVGMLAGRGGGRVGVGSFGPSQHRRGPAAGLGRRGGGPGGRRGAVLVGSLAGATAFDFFDTPPYGQLFMTRGRDVATTMVLIGASLLVGELAVRLRRYRTMATRRGEDFTVMSEAAQLMSFGDGADLVVAALAGELVVKSKFCSKFCKSVVTAVRLNAPLAGS